MEAAEMFFGQATHVYKPETEVGARTLARPYRCLGCLGCLRC